MLSLGPFIDASIRKLHIWLKSIHRAIFTHPRKSWKDDHPVRVPSIRRGDNQKVIIHWAHSVRIFVYQCVIQIDHLLLVADVINCFPGVEKLVVHAKIMSGTRRKCSHSRTCRSSKCHMFNTNKKYGTNSFYIYFIRFEPCNRYISGRIIIIITI